MTLTEDTYSNQTKYSSKEAHFPAFHLYNMQYSLILLTKQNKCVSMCGSTLEITQAMAELNRMDEATRYEINKNV